ncbi:hypothetical protein ACOME3_004828 [Neoechinorhynchus agilis]
MSISLETVATPAIFSAVNAIHEEVCHALGLGCCIITPISYKSLGLESDPTIYLVKAIVTKPGCPPEDTVCLFRIAVNLNNAENLYTLVSVKCNVLLDDEIIAF